jgi:hypothetical protein
MSWESIGDFEDIIYEKRKGVAKSQLTARKKEMPFAPKL